jgi:hypothetical protein
VRTIGSFLLTLVLRMTGIPVLRSKAPIAVAGTGSLRKGEDEGSIPHPVNNSNPKSPRKIPTSSGNVLDPEELKSKIRAEELETLEHNVKAAVEHNKPGATKRPVEFVKRSTASASLRIAM